MQVTHGLDSAVLSKRSQHNTIAIEEVRDGSKKRAARMVVVPDRRVVERLEDLGLWRAYENIAMAVSIRTAGLGVMAMDLSRVRGGTGNIEHGADLIISYDKWINECKRKYLSPLMVLDMIVDGLSFKEIDKKRQFMSGTASKNMIACLELWSK